MTVSRCLRCPSALMLVALGFLSSFTVGVCDDSLGERGSNSGGDSNPNINILSPRHGAVLNVDQARVEVDVANFEMSLEAGCAIVYLNTVRRHKACSAHFDVLLGDLREGLSVVDVVLVDDFDRELEFMASASFHVITHADSRDPSRLPLHLVRKEAVSEERSESGLLFGRRQPLRLLASFATDAMGDALRRLGVSALATGQVDGVQLFMPSHIDADFALRNRHILQHRRGAGFWLWKPFLLNRTLHGMEEGDLLMYVDAQLTFTSSASPLFELAEKEPSGVVCFGMAVHSERKFSKRKVLSELGCSHAACLDAPQRAATFILFRNSPQTRTFVEHWLTLCERSELINDDEEEGGGGGECEGEGEGVCGEEGGEDEEFLAHRHDQSIFSVLSKQYGIPAYRLPTQYGLHPEEQGLPGDYPQILQAK